MDIEVASPITVEAEVQTYTLVSDDIYVKRYDTSNIPGWYASMIESLIETSSTITNMDDVIQYLSNLEAGYNTKFANLETVDSSTNALLSSLVSTTGGHTAAISSLGITKTDAASAAAIARDTVGAYFADGSAGAFFDSKISTYASDVEANASNISVLGTTLNGVSARITTAEDVIISQGLDIQTLLASTDGSVDTYYQPEAPAIAYYGDWWVDIDSNPIIAYRYEDSNGLNTGTLLWTDRSTDVVAMTYINVWKDNTRIDNIINGIEQIDLSNNLKAIGWDTSISAIEEAVAALDLGVGQHELDLANLDNLITIEEASRIAAVNNEAQARIAAISDRVAEEARLDGIITSEEQARINAINSVEAAYKEYSRVVTLAMADGILTAQEQASIASAMTAVNVAKARFLEVEQNAKDYSDATLDSFLTTTYDNDISNIFDAVDLKAVSYFQATEPFAAASGTLAQDGDIWWNSTTKLLKVYKFNTKTWDVITDPKAVDAYDLADEAKAVADGKITSFSGTTLPVAPYDVGDVWMAGPTGDIRVCDTARTTPGTELLTDWELAGKYTDDTKATSAYGLADGKIKTWFQDDAPTAVAVGYERGDGDFWVDTNNGNLTKVWKWVGLPYPSGTGSWVDTTSTVANQALEWSATASKLITAPDGSITGWEFSDGSNQVSDFKIKATNFSISDGTTGYTPFSIVGSDVNFNGKVSFSSISDPENVATAINANTTTIDGGKITTDAVFANRVLAENITATGTITGGEIRSSDFTTIGGAGFRLKSNAAGTHNDPTIYGAHIRGGVLSASILTTDSLKVSSPSYPYNSAPFGSKRVVDFGTGSRCSSVNSPGILVSSPSYSSGYREDRIVNSNLKRTITISKGLAYHVAWVVLYRSIDNGGWVAIHQSAAGEGGTSYTVSDTYGFLSTCMYMGVLGVDCGNDVWVSAQLIVEFSNFD
jgi:hypothetical protein